jgi:hypothetical protein
MSRALMLWVAGAVLAFPLVPGQAVPLPIHKGRRHGPPPRPLAREPVGKWSVKFSNGVNQVCTIRKDVTASVVEPQRSSGGKWTATGGLIVIVYEDDRIERWTPVGKRFVVEHWFPATQMSTGRPVLGIAERAP